MKRAPRRFIGWRLSLFRPKAKRQEARRIGARLTELIELASRGNLRGWGTNPQKQRRRLAEQLMIGNQYDVTFIETGERMLTQAEIKPDLRNLRSAGNMVFCNRTYKPRRITMSSSYLKRADEGILPEEDAKQARDDIVEGKAGIEEFSREQLRSMYGLDMSARQKWNRYLPKPFRIFVTVVAVVVVISTAMLFFRLAL